MLSSAVDHRYRADGGLTIQRIPARTAAGAEYLVEHGLAALCGLSAVVRCARTWREVWAGTPAFAARQVHRASFASPAAAPKRNVALSLPVP